MGQKPVAFLRAVESVQGGTFCTASGTVYYTPSECWPAVPFSSALLVSGVLFSLLSLPRNSREFILLRDSGRRPEITREEKGAIVCLN